MKKWISLFGTAALVFGVAFLTVAHAAPKAAPAPAVTAAAQPAPNATPAPEPHPEIHAALDALRDARAHIHDAAHDFGGHRAEALRAVDAAIHQLDVCMRYDR